MSSEISNITSEPPTTASRHVVVAANYNDTELTLGLPGEFRKSGAKRRFSDNNIIDLKLGPNDQIVDTQHSLVTKVPPVKEQVIGWPPVRSYRKNMTPKMSECKYVKVAVDGAPYLRKIDLQSHLGYHQLLCAFQHMFTLRNVSKEMKLMDPVSGMEYVPTYEDKDGDWMLVGDVPWKMFVESCKRIRLMKSSEAINGSDLLKKC